VAKTWQIWVTVYDWHDGDSAHCSADLGCRVYIGSQAHPALLRCALINAPELSTGAPGQAATAYATHIAPPGEYPALSTGLDNYGRPLIDLVLPNGRMFSDEMLESGHAVRYRA
jgi:endonuclease YncB( thermonuclease family)